jgi:hypothetical protein
LVFKTSCSCVQEMVEIYRYRPRMTIAVSALIFGIVLALLFMSLMIAFCNPLCQYRSAGPSIPRKTERKPRKTGKPRAAACVQAYKGAIVPGAVWDKMQALLFVFRFCLCLTTESTDRRGATTVYLHVTPVQWQCCDSWATSGQKRGVKNALAWHGCSSLPRACTSSMFTWSWQRVALHR